MVIKRIYDESLRFGQINRIQQKLLDLRFEFLSEHSILFDAALGKRIFRNSQFRKHIDDIMESVYEQDHHDVDIAEFDTAGNVLIPGSKHALTIALDERVNYVAVGGDATRCEALIGIDRPHDLATLAFGMLERRRDIVDAKGDVSVALTIGGRWLVRF